MKDRIRQCIIVSLAIALLAGSFVVLSYRGFVPFGARVLYWDHTHFLRSTWTQGEEPNRFMDSDGSLCEGWYRKEDKKSYFVHGLPVTGPCEIDGKQYFFDDEGYMETGIVSDGQVKRYYSDEGVLQTGWIHLSEDTYYFDENGMKTGWFEDKHRTWYFTEDGKMLTGWGKISGRLYNFREDGTLRNDGWYQEGQNTYYLNPDGHASSGRAIIDNQVYFFSDSCRMFQNCWVGNSYAGEDGVMVRSLSIDGLSVDDAGVKVYHGSYGSGGSLYIPSLSLKVPVYLTPGGPEGQDITDRGNSAACLTSFRMPVIADHKNQGFEAIKQCLPGRTIAFVLTPDSVTEYVCTSLCVGSNVEDDILDAAGKTIDDSGADLCLYTCNEDWKHVTIVFFRKIKSAG